MTNNQEPTLFEKIINGELPCTKVYEDDDTFAFLDIYPNNPGHTLVVPKKPYRDIYDMNKESIASLFETVQKVSVAIKEAMKADGVKIMMNNEPAADQEVFHAHVHVIPRFKDDEYPNKYEYKDGESEEVAEKITREVK